MTLTVPRLPAGTTAVTPNVTATNPSSISYIRVYPAGTTRSSASNLNVVRGQTIPNLVTVTAGTGNKVSPYYNSDTIDLIADQAGHHARNEPGPHSFAPQRFPADDEDPLAAQRRTAICPVMAPYDRLRDLSVYVVLGPGPGLGLSAARRSRVEGTPSRWSAGA